MLKDRVLNIWFLNKTVVSEYEEHCQSHQLRTPRPAGTVSKLCFLSSARITARGRQGPWRGSGFAAELADRGLRAHACAGRKRAVSKRTGDWGEEQAPYISLSLWYGPGLISAYWLGFCRHDRAPIVLYPISPTWALVIKLNANYRSQTVPSRQTMIGL